MPSLDPQVRQYLEAIASQNLPSITGMTPREARERFEAATALIAPGPEVATVEDHHFAIERGRLRARVYRAELDSASPALVYFHGGGWVVGGIESHDALCRSLARECGVSVVSVDYALAPEHRFPVAATDAFAATSWVAQNARELGLDPRRIAVGGDSAGGNLAAVAAIQARNAGGPALRFQLLLYPITDCDLNTSSYTENANGFLLTRAEMAWFWDHYEPDHARRSDPLAAPLRVENATGLPPGLVITAEFDPLRDEGEAYARKLQAAGVEIRASRYRGMIHGFVRRHELFDQGRAALAECAAALRAALA